MTCRRGCPPSPAPSSFPSVWRGSASSGRTTECVLNKLHEEIEELEHEIRIGDLDKAREELGDILFVCANLGRDLGVDPEDALRAANAKFTRRFQFIEAALAEAGRSPEQSDLEEMEALWSAAKIEERRKP